MSEVGDIHHLPAIQSVVRPKNTGTERRHVPEYPERDKKQQMPPQADDNGEEHIDEYA